MYSPQLHSPETAINRRGSERFPLSWRVLLEDGEGQTRDISVGGVYFETDRAVSRGTEIRFMLIPPRRADAPPLRGCIKTKALIFMGT